MTPVELLTGIEDRFALLGGGRRRQSRRTLEATLDWSYELLDTDEQAALRALGVFVGTFDLAAVAAVTALPRDVARDLVDSLIAKSLVVHEEAGGLSQFRLFETTAVWRRGIFSGPTGPTSWPLSTGRLERVSGRQPPECFRSPSRCSSGTPPRESSWSSAVSPILTMRTTLSAVSSAVPTGYTYWRQTKGVALTRLAAIDPENGAEEIAEARAIQRQLPFGPDATQAAAVIEFITGMRALYQRPFEVALEQMQLCLDLHEELGFQTELSAIALQATAVLSLLDGDAERAMEWSNRYSATPSTMGTGDEIKALVCLALDHMDQATESAQAHARIAVTGRVVGQATDTLLVLAAFAEAEGDITAARNLITGISVIKHGALISYSSDLANRLGISEEYEANQHELRADRTGQSAIRQAATDIETLRSEMSRLGWLATASP
jgi:hypothetical protein